MSVTLVESHLFSFAAWALRARGIPTIFRTLQSSLVPILICGVASTVSVASNVPVAIAPTGRPPVALAPPHHTPMPSVRLPLAPAVGGPVVAETAHDSDHAGAATTPVVPFESALPSRPLRPRRSPSASGDVDAEATRGAAGWWFNTAWALVVVVVAIVALRGLLRRLGRSPGGAGRGAVLEVVGRISTGPRSSVLAVRVGHRIVIVGQTATGLSMLADLSDPNEVASVLATVSAERSGSMSRGFASIFNHASRDYDEDVRVVEEGGDMAEFGVDRARDEVSGLLSRVRSMVGRRPS